jgi:DNA-binding response OmpR family regulator
VAARILVVDDEPAIREMVTCALTDAGYEVINVANGLLGLDVAAGRDLDLVVTNNWMLNPRAAEMIAILQKHIPSLPVLHLDDSTDFTPLAYRVAEGVPTLSKPLNIRAFQAAVRALVRGG